MPFITGHKNEGKSYLPDPDEIAAECALIQAEWSAEEEYKRRCIKNPEARIMGADKVKPLEQGEIAQSRRTMREKHGVAKNWIQGKREHYLKVHGNAGEDAE